MKNEQKLVKKMLDELKECLDNDIPISQKFFDTIQLHPDLGLYVLESIPNFDNTHSVDEGELMVSLHFIELCLTFLRVSSEHEQRWALKTLTSYQEKLLEMMQSHPNSEHWVAVINTFYNADIVLTEDIKRQYLHIIKNIHYLEKHQPSQKQLLQQLLSDDSDSDEFDVVEMFFAQSNALPDEYFLAFAKELLAFELKKATDTAVLFLMHPKQRIRQLILNHLKDIFSSHFVTPKSLTRLLVIRQWLLEKERGYIDELLKQERKKGTEFLIPKTHKLQGIKASEMDPSGSQAIFLISSYKKHYYTTGILLKTNQGIKDAWITPPAKEKSQRDYSLKAMYQSIALRKVDTDYVTKILSHYLYLGLNNNEIPKIRLLQAVENFELKLLPRAISTEQEIAQLKSQAPEINDDWMANSIKRSGKWHKDKEFTASWVEESKELDLLVNRHCNFIEGTKYCNIQDAQLDVLDNYFEQRRAKWLNLFLWMALWAKPAARHNEYLWKDFLVLCIKIKENTPLKSIPLMQAIAELCIIASIETMELRKTHLG